MKNEKKNDEDNNEWQWKYGENGYWNNVEKWHNVLKNVGW